MKVNKKNDKNQEITITSSEKSKIEYLEIVTKIPDALEPGSDLEKRYLNYLVSKYKSK